MTLIVREPTERSLRHKYGQARYLYLYFIRMGSTSRMTRSMDAWPLLAGGPC